MNRRKGISLIVLVITIIVIIILAGAVILSLANNNPISQANEATYKSNIDAYNSELSMSLSKLYVDNPNLDIKTVNKPAWTGSGTTLGTVKDYIPSMSDDDAKKYAIQDGKLRYTGTEVNEIKWIADTGLSGYTYKFNYTGSVQPFTAPATGTYKFELWGAAGGNDGDLGSKGASGGYSYGEYNLTKGQMLYVFIGGKGVTQAQATGGGYNGGGNAGVNGSSGGGGGATDIRTVTGLWNDATSLSSRLIVAGGGGGAGYSGYTSLPASGAGAGGGLTGGNGAGSTTNGATQTTGGTSTYGNGSLGQGANHTGDGGGGGGGYYGGGAGVGDNGGGGGSGYIGGVQKGQTTTTNWANNGYAEITLIK